MTKLNIFLLLVLLAGSTISLSFSSAEEVSDSTATVRVNISALESEQPQSVWRRALSYIGIRGSVVKYPAPGSGLTVHSTAYAPSPYQTDSTPCITAAGTRVRPGVVATNMLPFGTLLQIGNEVYIVEDRMNPRYKNSIDIYFPSTSEALDFGRQEVDVVVLGYGKPGQTLPREEPVVEDEGATVKLASKESAPGFGARLIGRINQWQKIASDLAGIRSNDVNRFDIDCF
jgi:3D (Asp-Asp-Asp) domain-containing protein